MLKYNIVLYVPNHYITWLSKKNKKRCEKIKKVKEKEENVYQDSIGSY